MEELAAYAVMASATVGLYKELLFPSEEERIPSTRQSSYLSTLRRQEDEEDDTMTLALLSLLWQDEVAASLVTESSTTKTTTTKTVPDPVSASAPGSQAPTTENKCSELTSLKQQQAQASPPTKRSRTSATYGEPGEFGLRLNLDNTSHYGVSFHSPMHYTGLPGDFYTGDSYRVHFHDQSLETSHHQLQQHQLHHHQHHHQAEDHLGDELALGTEHPFVSHHYSPQDPSSPRDTFHHQDG